jgi:hypothetical protein
MKDGNEPQNDSAATKPQQQTGEQHGSIKRAGLSDRNSPEPATPRGAETGGGVGGAGPHRGGRHC